MARNFNDENIRIYTEYRDRIPELGHGRVLGRIIANETGQRDLKGWARTIKALYEYEKQLNEKIENGEKLDQGEMRHARMLGLAMSSSTSSNKKAINRGPADQTKQLD